MEGAAAGANRGANNPGGVRDPLLSVADRLTHTIFYRMTLTYARACPRPVRRIFETIVLLKAVLCFSMLIYIHTSFARRPVQCLEHVKDSWPRDGIIRVEIVQNAPQDYGIDQSYEKERKMQIRSRQQDEISMLVAAFSSDGVIEDIFGSSEEDDDDEDDDDVLLEANPEKLVEQEADHLHEGEVTSPNVTQGFVEDVGNGSTNETPIFDKLIEDDPSSNVSMREKEESNENQDGVYINEDITEYEKFKSVVWPDEEYIVEYSLEYGFLRLSPATRHKLNITVKIVVLDPNKDACFGDFFSQSILQSFLGYDDVLMSSIKSLAENEDNRGYLRNVVTGAHYHFVSRSTGVWNYFTAGLVMIIFTVCISILLRYCQHQIFVFIMELLQMLEYNTAISFPAASLLTVILAFVGMEAIMSEFFEDTTTAVYIMLIVWVADHYDVVCCHTPITKRFWLRFFYLYHFSFYAYHYRFGGQYSGLALLTMWLFTQHSMIYFFHHYELPVILQQAQIQDLLMRNQGDGGPPPAFRITAQRINNNNNAANNNNVVVNRPRMRGFNIGGIRFRFGVVFHQNQQQQQQRPQQQQQQEQQQQTNQQSDQQNDEQTNRENNQQIDQQNDEQTNRENNQQIDQQIADQLIRSMDADDERGNQNAGNGVVVQDPDEDGEAGALEANGQSNDQQIRRMSSEENGEKETSPEEKTQNDEHRETSPSELNDLPQEVVQELSQHSEELRGMQSELRQMSATLRRYRESSGDDEVS